MKVFLMGWNIMKTHTIRYSKELFYESLLLKNNKNPKN